MKVDNQLAFKSAYFTKSADIAMSKRLASGEFDAIRTKFLNRYKNSKIKVSVSTVNEKSTRLDADIEYNGKKYPFAKESRWERFWYTPARYIEKLSEKIDYIEESTFGKRSQSGKDLMV